MAQHLNNGTAGFDATGYLVPTVVKQTNRGERAFDIFSRLLTDRIIFVADPIMPETAGAIVAQLLHLESDDPNKAITLYISSPGGDIRAMFSIIDTMNFIKPPVSTICIGMAASAAALILAAGEPGMRIALPNASVMIHQPSVGSIRGQSTDIELTAVEIEKMKDRVNKQLASTTGKSIEDIARDTDRDRYLTAEEALEYGIIDQIVQSREAQGETRLV